jgi:hypothetical protein
LYHSDRCNTSETVFHWCYVNDLHTIHAVVCWVTTLPLSRPQEEASTVRLRCRVGVGSICRAVVGVEMPCMPMPYCSSLSRGQIEEQPLSLARSPHHPPPLPLPSGGTRSLRPPNCCSLSRRERIKEQPLSPAPIPHHWHFRYPPSGGTGSPHPPEAGGGFPPLNSVVKSHEGHDAVS